MIVEVRADETCSPEKSERIPAKTYGKRKNAKAQHKFAAQHKIVASHSFVAQ